MKRTSGDRGLAKLLLFQLGIAVVVLLAGKPHTAVHGMDWPFPTSEQVASFDFVGRVPGEEASIFAVLMETMAWSFLGVFTRAMYRLAVFAKTNEQFAVMPVAIRLLGEAAAGISIAVALVALLWSSELKVVDITISLKDAGIGSIIAVSFVLGFFHENTVQLLGRVQGSLFSGDTKGEEDGT